MRVDVDEHFEPNYHHGNILSLSYLIPLDRAVIMRLTHTYSPLPTSLSSRKPSYLSNPPLLHTSFHSHVAFALTRYSFSKPCLTLSHQDAIAPPLTACIFTYD